MKEMNTPIIQIHPYQSPCGELILGSFEGKLCMCDWTMNEERRDRIDKRIQTALHAHYEPGYSEIVAQAIAQLNEYFSGKRTTFDIPLLFIGTDFQKSVWQELLNIPYRTTVSYRELAVKLGNAKAVRAVAAANGANAISIFVPCHRVIGSNRKLTGYAGGLDAKKSLLNIENREKLF